MRVQIHSLGYPHVPHDELALAFGGDCRELEARISISDIVYKGYIDNQLVCVWGLIAPTLMSSRAYLWLQTSELAKDQQFLFVRHSQKAIEEILKTWPEILGHAHADNTRGIRWLRWLGAKFKDPEGKKIPFVIRRD